MSKLILNKKKIALKRSMIILNTVVNSQDINNSSNKTYTMDQVKLHNKLDDCWVVVNGDVLDVTDFISDHPGGKQAIIMFAGKNATEEFNMLHKPDVIYKYLEPNTQIKGKLSNS